MNIMIDYDRTYTAAVEMWREVIDNGFLYYGHKVFLVTARSKDQPIELARDFDDRNIPIIYCAFKAKREVCEALGIKIDIWIDDEPDWIVKDIDFDPNRGKVAGEIYTILSLTGGNDQLKLF